MRHHRAKYLLLSVFSIILGYTPQVPAQIESFILSQSAPTDNQIVEFADPALEKAIREAINVPAPQPLTRAQLAQITELNIEGEGISMLDGIETLVNLEVLDLRKQPNSRFNSSSRTYKSEAAIFIQRQNSKSNSFSRIN